MPRGARGENRLPSAGTREGQPAWMSNTMITCINQPPACHLPSFYATRTVLRGRLRAHRDVLRGQGSPSLRECRDVLLSAGPALSRARRLDAIMLAYGNPMACSVSVSFRPLCCLPSRGCSPGHHELTLICGHTRYTGGDRHRGCIGRWA